MPFAQLTDVRLYYEVLGQGEPVLFIPGLGATCRMWDSVAPDLSEEFTLILPDNRGVGQSVPLREPRTLADLSADLVELLDDLQLDRIHVVGISLGGVIAQRLAMDHPSRIKRLVLMSTAHRFGPYLRDVAHLLAQSLYRMPYALFLQTIELLGTAPQYYDDHIDAMAVKTLQASRGKVDRRAIVTQLKCLAASEVADGDYQIQAPTLVLAGEYDALIPNCYSQEMAAVIPHSQFKIIPGCGHNPATERPDLVLPLLIEFLNRRDDVAQSKTQTKTEMNGEMRGRDGTFVRSRGKSPHGEQTEHRETKERQ